MPAIVSVGVGKPPYYSQERVFQALGHRKLWWKVFEGAGLRGRPLYSPPEIAVARSPQEQQEAYVEASLALARQAVAQALQGQAQPQDIRFMAYASCTGVPLCPSLPSILGGEMGMPEEAIYYPVWGMGCQGAGPILRLAWEHLRLYPQQKALCLAVEISNAAYHPRSARDGSPDKGLILGNAIFSDGAGCALLSGMGGRLMIVDCVSLWDYTHRGNIGMAWVENRYKLELTPDVPEIITPLARKMVEGILRKSGLMVREIPHFILHSGGAAIIEGVQRELGLSDSQVRLSWETWKEGGNRSSATVFYALERLLEEGGLKKGDHIILITLGAGVECVGIHMMA